MKNLLPLLLALFLIPFFPAQAQTAPLALHLEQVDTSDYPVVSLRLNAWDASGLPLAGLAAENFALREDQGAPFRPADLQIDPNASLGVVLVLDISGSMQGQPIADARAAAARFLDRLQKGDRAALVAFSDPVETDPAKLDPGRELDFATDLVPVYDLVENLEAGGQTQLYNAELKAVRLAAALPPGHRVVLLLSDGRNEPAEVGDPGAALQLAREANIPFFVIGLGDQIDEAHLRQLASETGGLYRSAPRSSELAQLFNNMASLFKTQYQLSYESQLPADGAKHTLAVSLNAPQGEAQAQIEFYPLPAAGTLPPTVTLPAPSATAAPTAAPLPSAPPVDSTDGNVTTPGQPWAWPLAALLSLFLGIVLVIARRKRRPSPPAEICSQCGVDLTGKPGTCPQCGSSRRLPKRK